MMKKTIFFLTILSIVGLAVTGCEDVTEYYEDHAQQLEVSSPYVIFSAEGGSRTVLVTSSDTWDFTVSGTWVEAMPGDGLLEISADANTTGANRQSSIIVTAGSLTETISVSQTFPDDDSADLSEDENANCYIANTMSSYRFNATVKGNGLAADYGGIKAYTDAYGVNIDPDEIVYADLLWETTLDGDRTRSRAIINGNPVYNDGYVYFTTGTAEGNAVIAVKDAQGTVLWSWHIWVTDAEIGETYGNGFYWMDRNLGANSKESRDVTNRGLFYQWGRKDPFLPSTAEYGADQPDVLNYEVGDGSGTWNYSDYSAGVSLEAPGNIPLSIRVPMSLIQYNGVIYSWYISSRNEDLCQAYLWGNSEDLSTYVKSIFDPCPAGYNVPVDSPWISSKDQDVNYWYGIGGNYGLYWTGGGNAFYPVAGVLLGSTGELSGTSSYGYYWCSGKNASDSSYSTYCLYFNSTNSISYTLYYPVMAMPVRCMRVE